MKAVKSLSLLLFFAASTMVAMDNQPATTSRKQPISDYNATSILRQYFLDEPLIEKGKYVCEECKKCKKATRFKAEIQYMKHMIYVHAISAMAERIMEKHPEIFSEENTNKKIKTDPEIFSEENTNKKIKTDDDF